MVVFFFKLILHPFETVELVLCSCPFRQLLFLWQSYLMGSEPFSIELSAGPFGQQVFYLSLTEVTVTDVRIPTVLCFNKQKLKQRFLTIPYT